MFAAAGPGGVARADHEQPLAVAAGVRDHHRRAGELGGFLEAVDVGVARLAEHAQRGGKAAQRGPLHHQAVARGLRGRHGVEIGVGRRSRPASPAGTGLPFDVVQRMRRAAWRYRRSSHAPVARSSCFGSARRSCIEASCASRSAFCAAICAGGEHDRIGVRQLVDPELRRELGLAHAQHARRAAPAGCPAPARTGAAPASSRPRQQGGKG